VRYELWHEELRLDEGFRLAPLLESMESAIRLRVGQTAPGRLFVHAGAVAWRDRAIVIPGRSGAGKTTLVAALIAAGATYFSDEYAVLDKDGLLHPYARPLSIRQGENRRLRQCAVNDLGGHAASTPLPVGFVIQTAYRPGANWEPTILSTGEGAHAMFANTLAARDRPAFAYSILSRAASGALSLAGDRGEAEATAKAILSYSDSFNSAVRGTTP